MAVKSADRITVPERPQLVQDSIKNNRPIYYFGLGSNMSRKKLENRGINGTKIDIQTMEAAIVKNFRLAFNMRGFPPIEPGMGSLEPIHADTKPLLRYEHNECHGALVKLTPENYEKVMRSEGVGNPGQQDQGYEEVVVEAYPYRRPTKPVQAIALRARDHVRLPYDPCPSERYMKILREGAKELDLRPCYQKFLQLHPVQSLTKWQRKEAIYNLICMTRLSSLFRGWRGFSRFQNRLLFAVYYASPPNVTTPIVALMRKAMSDTLTAFILLPGAIIGFLYYHIMKIFGTLPSSVSRIINFLDVDHS
jgi:hypothetical protein